MANPQVTFRVGILRMGFFLRVIVDLIKGRMVVKLRFEFQLFRRFELRKFYGQGTDRRYVGMSLTHGVIGPAIVFQ